VIEAGLWGLFAASSLVLGAAVAELRPPGMRLLGLVMGFGSGVLLSAVSFELIEEAVETSGALRSTFLGFFVGAIVFTVGDLLIGRMGYANRKDIGGSAPDAGGLTIVLGAMLDGIPESAVIGLTVLQTGEVGAAVLVAVFVSNIPEGIAATVGLRAGDGQNRRCMRCGWGSPWPQQLRQWPATHCSTVRPPTPWRSCSPSPVGRS
jgi:zinc transporter, ZIP family